MEEVSGSGRGRRLGGSKYEALEAAGSSGSGAKLCADAKLCGGAKLCEGGRCEAVVKVRSCVKACADVWVWKPRYQGVNSCRHVVV